MTPLHVRSARGIAVAVAVVIATFGNAGQAQPLSAAERREIARITGVTVRDDAHLIAAAESYAATEFGQRIVPRSVDRLWAIEPTRHDVHSELAAARARGELGAWLKDASPPSAGYRAMQAARDRYASLAKAGGWSRLEPGLALRKGDHGPGVASLRTRLFAEGFLRSDGGRDFDAELEGGFAEFQQSHSLEVDGVLGPATLAALNVTASERLAQVEANLERWRWLPRDLPADRFEVDIAGAEARLFRNDRPVLDMRVIVGDPRHHTPMFGSRVEAVIVNPSWNVPASIATREILPRARRDPGLLARNGFTFVHGRLIQRPGPKNSLGVIKFDLPSPFGVYLHDTPSKSLFRERVRTLSHGCMRLEKSREFALQLLEEQGVSAELLSEAIASGRTQRFDLRRRLPLYVLYWTVVADPAGKTIFRPDVYGWDAKLNEALRARIPKPRSLSDTDCAD